MTASAGDADWVRDADWDLTSAAADGFIVEGDWVLADGPSPPPPPRHHLIGFFLADGGRHVYVPLLRSSDASRAADLISSAPISASICASAQGIVLARAPWSSYYVSTPISPKWTRIPKPIRSHPISIPIALVAGGGGGTGFLIVCAVPTADGPLGFYRFDVYDSSAGKWRIGPDRFPAGEILPSSGVSCGGAAYFRTETPSVVAYDDAAGVARVLPPPPRCWGSETRWELAEGDGRLRCVCVRGRAVEAYQLGERDQWALLEQSDAIVSDDPPRPLRAQSDGPLGAVLWVNGRLGRWDLQRGSAIGFGLDQAAPPPGSCGEYVPYCAGPDLRR